MSLIESAAYLVARVAPAVLGLVLVAILTRQLEASEYGYYALAMSAASLANVAAFYWHAQAVFRHFASARENVRSLATAGAVGYSLSLLTVALCSAVAGTFVGPAISTQLIVAAVVMSAALAWVDMSLIFLNLQRRTGAYVGLQVARAAMSVAAGATGARLTGTAWGVVLSVGVAHIGLTLIGPFSQWVRWIDWRSASMSAVGVLFKYGMPLSASILLMQVVATADRFILSHLVSPAEAGAYAVGSDLAQFAVGAVAGAVNLAFYPKTIALLELAGHDSARAQIARYSVVLAAISLPAAVGLALVGRNLVGALVGVELRQGAAAVIPWLSAAAFLAAMKSFLADYAFQLGKWTIGGALGASVGVAVSLSLNFTLVPRLGGVGAARASVAAFGTALAVSLIAGRWSGFRLPGLCLDHARVAVATILMAAILWVLRDKQGPGWLLIQIGVGTLVYVGACYALDVLGVRSRSLVRTFWSSGGR